VLGTREGRRTNVEQVALRLFVRADERHEVITRSYVDKRLADLRTHSPHCRCDSLCRLSRNTHPASVYRTASAWQREIGATRMLAAR
jgi:hypothetical protein